MEGSKSSPLLTTSDRTKEDGSRKRSLKHKHKKKAGNENSEPGDDHSNAKVQGKDDAASSHMHDLLTSKIAQLQVGDESLDVDINGIFSDVNLVETSNVLWNTASQSNDSEQMDKVVHIFFNHMTNFQKKIRELHSKYIVIREQKSSLVESNLKINATKGKLETLCRELQKQNKTIITESRRIAEEEDAKRKQLSQQFQTTIEEVSRKMEQQGKDYVASLQDNEALQTKLKQFLSQYELREEHYNHQLQAKDLAVQLAEAKLQHQIELTSREAEKVELSMDKIKMSVEREAALQTQLGSYSEKFEVVQETLSKSNTMFVTLRDEMDKMSKHIKRLEKENGALKKKCDQYDRGALDLLQERGRAAEESKRQLDKISKLEGLCRMLQAERNRLKEQQANDTAAS